jgi:hypothetical protein
VTGGRNLTSVMLILASWIVMRVGLAGRSEADEPVVAVAKVVRPAQRMPVLVTVPAKLHLAERSLHVAKVELTSDFAPLRMIQIVRPDVLRRPRISALDRTSSLPAPLAPTIRIAPAAVASTSETGEPRLDSVVSASRRQPSNVTGSYWSSFRDNSGASPLAGRGELGGSQAGFRLTAPLPMSVADGQFAVSLRGYSPLARKRGKEAALGISWSRRASLPVELIIERRIGLDRDGRNAVAALVTSGFGPVRVGQGWAAQGYAQAGMVGLRKRDGFADGQVSLARKIVLPVLGETQIGGGVWAGAQPQVHRVDAGPQVRIPLNIGPSSSQISTEWRFRLAGNARPSSGPTLTVTGSF